jgi:hypothetical protein
MYVFQSPVCDKTYPDAPLGGLTPFSSQLFSKLSHHIEGLLKKLPRADKLDVSCLLEFLVDVIKIRNVCPMPDTVFQTHIHLFFERSGSQISVRYKRCLDISTFSL